MYALDISFCLGSVSGKHSTQTGLSLLLHFVFLPSVVLVVLFSVSVCLGQAGILDFDPLLGR